MQSHSNPRRSAKVARNSALTLGLALWIATPLALWVNTTADLKAAEMEIAQEVRVPLTKSDGTVENPVELSLTWQGGSTIASGSLTGVVQSIAVAPHASIANGDVVLSIENRDRLAFHTTSPFFRPISQADFGEDVAALNSMLRDLGYNAPQSDRATAQTMSSVKQLDARLTGVRVGTATAFDPSWIIYMEEDEAEISSVEVARGEALSANQALAQTAPNLVAARLVQPGTIDMKVDVQNVDAPQSQPVSELEAIVPPETTELVVNNEVIELSPEDRSNVSHEGLESISKEVPPNTPGLAAALRVMAQEGAYLLPTGAVYTDAHGMQCVLVVRGHEGLPNPVRIHVQGTATGGVVATLDTSEDNSVIVTPKSNDRVLC